MVNLGELFRRAQGLVDDAVSTSGTTISIETHTKGEKDRVTLEQQTTVTEARNAPALITVLGEDVEVAPGFTARAGDWRLVLKASETPPRRDQFIRVATSRNNLVTGLAKVLGAEADSSGAYWFVYCTPRWQ